MQVEKYKSVSNTQGDSWGVGLVMTKEEWLEQLNQWQEADGLTHRYKIEDWDTLDDFDLRGVVLEKV